MTSTGPLTLEDISDQRAYERFRYWQTMLPSDQQRAPDLIDRYRAYLKGQGFADSGRRRRCTKAHSALCVK